MRILLAEDEKSMSRALCAILTKNNYSVETVYDGQDALDYLLGGEYDCAILDVMMPKMDGFTVLQKIRGKGITIPVMMLTAKGTEYDKVFGLDSGADDYLPKPFGMMELISRCKALLRRPPLSYASQGLPSGTITVGRISVNERDHQATACGVNLELTLKEFELLRKLAESPGQAFSRSQLLKDIWDISFGETRTVDTHIQTLRRKLNDACPGAGGAIETVRGVGYLWSA